MDIKPVEDKIRDLINEVRVMQQEEDEQGCQKVMDAAAEQIVEKLEQIARAVGRV